MTKEEKRDRRVLKRQQPRQRMQKSANFLEQGHDYLLALFATVGPFGNAAVHSVQRLRSAGA
jgi:hypothetical protein